MAEYAVIVLSVALAGFFSGSETGFYCVNRIRLRFRIEGGWPGARALERLSADPLMAVASMLVGTNVGVYLATVMCAAKLRGMPALAPRADLYASLIMPPILLLFAEIVPKSIFQRRADTLMYRAAPLLNTARRVFSPLLFVLGWLGGVMRRLGSRWGARHGEGLSEEKFRFFLSEGAALGMVSPYQQVMADNLLRIRSLKLDSAMVPLEGVVMIQEGAPLDELKSVLGKHRFSRIPLYGGQRSNIVGIVNVIDLLAVAKERPPLSEITRAPLSLDARLGVMDALYALQRARQQMAVVVSGEQAVGIVTVKDLVEEIVGELKDW